MKKSGKSKKNEKKKEKQKEKKEEKEKEEKQEKKEESEEEYYTEEELKRIDEFHKLTNHKFEDDEIYDLMEKFKDNDEAILTELKEQLKERKRGVEYEWNEVGKSN